MPNIKPKTWACMVAVWEKGVGGEKNWNASALAQNTLYQKEQINLWD